MPRVEETLAAYLSHNAVSSLNAPSLPTKPCCTTFSQMGKVYVVACVRALACIQWPSCKHTWTRVKAWGPTLLKNCVGPLIYFSVPPRRRPSPEKEQVTSVSNRPKPQCPPDNTAAVRGSLSLGRPVEIRFGQTLP